MENNEKKVNIENKVENEKKIVQNLTTTKKLFEDNILDIKKIINESQNLKVKVINEKIIQIINKLNEIYEEDKKNHKSEIEKINLKNNEDLKNKLLEIEDKAAKKVVERIELLDKKNKEEIENAKKFAMEKSISDAITVIDQLEIAINFAVNDPAVKNYVSGFKIVLDMFVKWLNKFDVHKIDIKAGDLFDENKMNALDKVSSNFPLNHVAVVQKSGYIMHDKVIRHALVSVSNGFNNTIQVMPQVTNNLNHQHNNVHMQQQNNKFYPHNNVVEPTKQFQNFNQGFSQQKNSQHSQIRQNVNNQQMYPTNVISKQVNIPTAVVNTAKNLSNSQNNEKKNK